MDLGAVFELDRDEEAQHRAWSYCRVRGGGEGDLMSEVPL